jgi:hypothetical protein
MKYFHILVLSVLVILSAIGTSRAQVSSDVAVQLQADVDMADTARPVLVIHWVKDSRTTTSYKVYRRFAGNGASWGPIHSVSKDGTEFRDTSLEIGKAYEYQVRKALKVITAIDTVKKDTTFLQLNATGYLQGGINVIASHDRGGIILVVDSTYASYLSNELDRLRNDLTAEGWVVKRIDVARSDIPSSVKDTISSVYWSHPEFYTSLLLFGHVPVPYSGFLNPDGHPDHYGAWPADMYYGEFDGDWTDEMDESASVDTNTIRKANLNMAGDGKFDQTSLPDNVNLEVGRVDLADMPAFAKSEKELLKQYLDKDHNYRVGLLTAPKRGLIDDNFGYFNGEAFASSGWRNLAPMVGIDSVHEIDWFTTLSTEPYLWAYGCGGGWDQGAGGIGATSDFASKGSKAIFTMLFGSYFGDWNTSDNFLRAPLATEYGLSCAWSGRPYWNFFPMGLGEPTGYCAKITQNNIGEYVFNYAAGGVHVALMGDPTLRLYPVMPPSALVVNTSIQTNSAQLLWHHSPDPTKDGYQIFRSNVKDGPFSLLATVPKEDSTYRDNTPLDSINYYFVHAYRLEHSPSGTYYNLSGGTWGQSNPLVNGVAEGTDQPKDMLTILETPISSQVTLSLSHGADVQLTLVDASGKILSEIVNKPLSEGEYRFDVSHAKLATGIYFVRAIGMKTPLMAKMLVIK